MLKPIDKKSKVLVRMYAHPIDRRGLGDAVQFNIVIKHIQHYYPEWEIHVESNQGKDSCHHGLCKKTYLAEERRTPMHEFDRVLDFRFDEPNNETCSSCLTHQVPATKPTDSIIKNLGKIPIKSLFTYDIDIDDHTRKKVKRYTDALPHRNGLVILHYQATSSPHNKNLEHHEADRICKSLLANGYTPLIFDWKKGSPLPNNKNIYCFDKFHPIWEGKNGDAKTIAAIIEQARLFIGVDSGPLHLAGATKTPTIGFWKFHHPAHYFDLCENVTHLLPGDARRFIRFHNKVAIEEYFNQNYKHSYYHNNRGDAVLDAMCRELSIERDGPGSGSNNGVATYVPFADCVSMKAKQWWPIKVKLN